MLPLSVAEWMQKPKQNLVFAYFAYFFFYVKKDINNPPNAELFGGRVKNVK